MIDKYDLDNIHIEYHIPVVLGLLTTRGDHKVRGLALLNSYRSILL